MSTTNHQSGRAALIAERQERMKALTHRVPMIRVEPTSDDYRKYLKHPRGRAFPASGAVDWPADRFTRRRIAEGSVRIVTAEHGASRQHGHPQHQQTQRRGASE